MIMPLSRELLERRELTEMKELLAAGENEQALLLYECSENVTADLCRYAIVAAREADMGLGYLLGIQMAAQRLRGYRAVEADIVRDLAIRYIEMEDLQQARSLLYSVPTKNMTTDQVWWFRLAEARYLLQARKTKEALEALEALAGDIPRMTDPQMKADIRWWWLNASILNWRVLTVPRMAQSLLNEGAEKKPTRVRMLKTAKWLIIGQLGARIAIWLKLGL